MEDGRGGAAGTRRKRYAARRQIVCSLSAVVHAAKVHPDKVPESEQAHTDCPVVIWRAANDKLKTIPGPSGCKRVPLQSATRQRYGFPFLTSVLGIHRHTGHTMRQTMVWTVQ